MISISDYPYRGFKGVKEGRTLYYLSDDDYIASSKYMETLGPLPENSRLEKVNEPIDNIRNRAKSKVLIVFERNDKKLIRTIVNNETENTEILNVAQDHNRKLLAEVDSMDEEELEAIQPEMPEI